MSLIGRISFAKVVPTLLPVRLCTASPYSSPERHPQAQGPWHLNTVKVPTSIPYRGASLSATVMMTQPELYLCFGLGTMS